MKLTVNGDVREAPTDATILTLLESLGLRPEIVAVEVNGELVPRVTHGERRLVEGDRIEFVTLVGGG